MSQSLSAVSFRVRHPSIDAGLIESAVGQIAKVKWTAGDARVTPKGTFLDGFRNDSYCTFDVPEANQLPLNGAIVSAVERLSAKVSDLKSLSAAGALIEFYVTIDRSERGEMIDAATVAALARLNAGLAIDWYN